MRVRAIDRRQVLRGSLAGAAVRIGLPLLGGMLNANGDALAQGTSLPRRVGIWFWGNGVRPEHWFPADKNPKWDPSLKEHTRPFADAGLTSYVSLVSGTSLYSARPQAHHDGKNIVLTGTWEWLNGRSDLGYGRALGPSVDRIAALQWKGLTRFDSLEFGVQQGYANNESGNAGHFTSTNGPDSYNRPETSPLAMWNRLFGGGPSASELLAQKTAAARKSILDAVADDTQRLSARLGTGDRARLALHLDTIRSVERRITMPAMQAGCKVPALAPADFPTVAGNQPLRDRNKSMSQVLALALACDLTRAFTYQFTVFQTAAIFYDIPVAREEFHEYSHNAGAQEDVRTVTTFTMENMAYTLKVLRDTPEGAGNLLDNCAIMGTTEHTEPMGHATDNLPMLIAGKAGGKLKGGVYYLGNRDRIAKAGLTVLRAAGVTLDTFGKPSAYGTPQTSDTFTALEA